MTVKADRKRRTHESILASAATLLRSRGIGGARVADVMDGAGLTVGGFYAHFASKKDLVDEALRQTCTALRDGLFGPLGDGPERVPGERMRRILAAYLSPAHRDQTSLGCPFPAVVGEIGTTAPEHGEVLAEQLERLTEALVLRLPRDSPDEPKPPSAPRTTALALVALLYGGLSLARATRGTALSDEILAACREAGATLTHHPERRPSTRKSRS